MTDFLLQQALGSDWHQLPHIIKGHYEIKDGQSACLEGVMTIAYPHFMLPIIGLIRLFGGLVFRRGRDVHTRVKETASAVACTLLWQRTMTYSDGKSCYFCSQMTYLAEHELLESINCGFGIRLQVAVNNGDLVYHSNGYYWQCGGIHLTLPNWLLLGTATISEHALSEHEFYLDFTIKHPWWGETYSYRGNFHYC